MDRTRLTPREMEVSRHAVAGSTNREIADKLGISVLTVEIHMKNVRTKMGVHSREWLKRFLADAR